MDSAEKAHSDESNHELVFALVGPAETDLDWVSAELANRLRDQSYEVLTIRLSQFLPISGIKDEKGTPVPLTTTPRDQYLQTYMDAGNELRRMVQRELKRRQENGQQPFAHEPGAALVYLAADFIGRVRERTDFAQLAGNSVKEILDHIEKYPQAKHPTEDKVIPRRAYILRSLKHPQEVYVLRNIYDSGAYVLSVHSRRALRKKKLADAIAAEHGHNENSREYKEYSDRAEKLLLKDEDEPDRLGQRVRDTFHLADFFLDLNDESPGALEAAARDIDRFAKLVMGDCLHTPTADEYFMFIAHAVAARSGSLGRQVGAVIATPEGELISVGSNEVPRAGGGQYWPNEHHDYRDVTMKEDVSNVQRRRIIQEIIEVIRGQLQSTETTGPVDPSTILERLDKKRFASVIEFSRTVHAEMEAILSAARRGASIQNAHLYTTTFPCHECARLIVGVGIARVIYIEPYPKSLAAELFQHEITLEDDSDTKPCAECGKPHRIHFTPFAGVGPHRYMELFSLATSEGRRRERKDAEGKAITSQGRPIRPLSPLSYLERESRAGIEIRELLKPEAPALQEEVALDAKEAQPAPAAAQVE